MEPKMMKYNYSLCINFYEHMIGLEIMLKFLNTLNIILFLKHKKLLKGMLLFVRLGKSSQLNLYLKLPENLFLNLRNHYG